MILSKKLLLAVFSVATIIVHPLTAMNKEKQHQLNQAALRGSIDEFNLIFDQAHKHEIEEFIFGSDEYGWTLLHHAVANISRDQANIVYRTIIIKKILAAAKNRIPELIAQQKIDGDTALHLAATGSHIEFITLLLQAAYDIEPTSKNNLLAIKNRRDLYAFDLAEIRKNQEVMDALTIHNEK